MIFSRPDEICKQLKLNDAEVREMEAISERYPMLIPEYYLNLIDPDDPDDPIRKMSVPTAFEAEEDGVFDTSGESDNTKIPGLQHKYRQTALILSTSRCAMYCRHCFRKRLVGLSDEEVAKSFDDIISYIREHEEITNVLISGGDALMNSDETLKKWLDALTAIDHLDYIRLGSRTIVTYPQRINGDPALCELLASACKKKQLYIVTQFNHPRELTPEAREAIMRLRGCGVLMRNQTVLLRGVNSEPAVLGDLLRKLTAAGCLPYYIFQCRPVKGVKNIFQLPLYEAVEVVEAAKALQNGFGKNLKFCMSHPLGKLEIVGKAPAGGMIFKFHEAKAPADNGRIFIVDLKDGDCWL